MTPAELVAQARALCGGLFVSPLLPELADALEAALAAAKDRELAHVMQMSRVMNESFDEGYAAATAAALLAAETVVDEYNAEVT